MTVRKVGTLGLVVLVAGMLWVLLANVLGGGRPPEATLTADLVVDGKVVPGQAAFAGGFGGGTFIRVEAVVGALGGTVERVGQKDERTWEYSVLALGGKRLVLYSGKPPEVEGSDVILVNETGRTVTSLGWVWSQADAKDVLKLVYPKVIIATTFNRDQPDGRQVFIETTGAE